ncbi:MAG: hypothetical protein ACOCUV_00295 [bacterium]
MKIFIANTYILISNSFALILFILWFLKKYEYEPLIGIILTLTIIISEVFKLLQKRKNNIIDMLDKSKRLRDLFKKELHKPFNPSEPLIGPNRFNCSKVIIHNIDAQNYDNVKPNKYGWCDYFSGEPYQITDEGFDLIIDLVRGEVDENNIFIYYEEGKMKLYKHAIIPYSNIVNYDFNNDEFRPYLYCKYIGELGPFKEIYYRTL